MKTVGQNQNLLDITIQYTGSLENLFEVAENTNLSITEELHAGDEVFIEKRKNLKAIMFSSNGWKPATGMAGQIAGIGYDAIPNPVY